MTENLQMQATVIDKASDPLRNIQRELRSTGRIRTCRNWTSSVRREPWAIVQLRDLSC
jgi:hypothetical protein